MMMQPMRSERLEFTMTRLLEQPCRDGSAANDGAVVPGGAHAKQWGSSHPAAEAPPQLDTTLVYLGETCVFDIALSNLGAPCSALTLKVEASVEGGSSAVLHSAPLQSVAYQQREVVRVSTDIKEQGLLTIVASAVFTDPTGERKYSVRFFKLTAASPCSVRTRVRHLPHICGSSSSDVGRTRCFLEVNVQNSTQLQMVLHAVRLLPPPGVHAQLVGGAQHSQQQPQLATATAGTRQHLSSNNDQLLTSVHQPPSSHHHAAMVQGLDAGGGANDTSFQQDNNSLLPASSTAAAGSAPSVQAKQQLLNGALLQPQQQAMTTEQQPGPSQAVTLLVGSSQNALWQIYHYLPAPAASNGGGSGGAAAAAAATSSSSSTLGRLELHWSTCDGRTGRLLTQPLSGPVPATGKEVLMQLQQLWCGAAVSVQQQQQQSSFSRVLPVCQPFKVAFTLTAGQHSVGPLLVLYTSNQPAASAGNITTSSVAVGSSGPSSSSNGGGLLATDSSTIQARRLGGGAGGAPAAGSGADSELVVLGARSVRVPVLAAGQSVTVEFECLPLRRGWVRLPTFVVASEADGRLLDGVHDVHLLVV